MCLFFLFPILILAAIGALLYFFVFKRKKEKDLNKQSAEQSSKEASTAP